MSDSTQHTQIQAHVVEIRRLSANDREYDAIVVHIADLHLRCDITNHRQIQMAKSLADSHGAEFRIRPDLQARVDAALVQGGAA